MTKSKTAIISALALVTSLGLSACANNEATPNPSETQPTAPSILPDPDLKVGETGIRFDLTDCDGCMVKLQSAPRDKLVWEGEWTAVTIGDQWLVMPTKYTKGLSIALTTPVVPDVQYNVVFNYEGQTIGDLVNAGSIADYPSAYGCWVGTTQRKVALAVQVNYVEDGTGKTVAQAYTQMGMNPFGKSVPVTNGSLTSTDFFACNG